MFDIGMWPTAKNIDINLDLCMRFLPHHNDDGGFFVALIKKTRPLPWETSTRKPIPIDSSLLSLRARNNLAGNKTKPKKMPAVVVERKGRKTLVRSLWQPKSFFKFLSKDDQEINSLLKTFGIPFSADLFYSPAETKKSLYMTNSALKSILQAPNKNLNVYHAGAKVFLENPSIKHVESS